MVNNVNTTQELVPESHLIQGQNEKTYQIHNVGIGTDDGSLRHVPVLRKMRFNSATTSQRPHHPEGELELGARRQVWVVWRLKSEDKFSDFKPNQLLLFWYSSDNLHHKKLILQASRGWDQVASNQARTFLGTNNLSNILHYSCKFKFLL